MPLLAPVLCGGVAKKVIPDVLCLPEVGAAGKGPEAFSDGQGLRHDIHLLPGGGCFQRHHGTLHAAVGGIAQDGQVQLDVVCRGAAQQTSELGSIVGVALQCAAETGVDCKTGGKGQGGRCRHVRFAKKMQQRGVFLVDPHEGFFDLGDGLIEDALEDAMLLVGKQGGQRIGLGMEEAVDQTDESRDVSTGDGETCLLVEAVPGFSFGWNEAFHCGRKALVAQMQYGEADFFHLVRNLRAHAGTAKTDAASAAGQHVVGLALHVEAEDLACIRGGLKHGGDGVVSADVLNLDARAGDPLAIDRGAISVFRHVAFRAGEHVEKLRFEGSAFLTEELGGELQNTAGIGNDLHGLNAGDVVEEPATAGVHELGVAFELEELEHGHALVCREGFEGVPFEEAVDAALVAIQNHRDVGIAGLPEIADQRRCQLFGEGGGAIAQQVECFTQGAAPGLVPAGSAAVATAVGAPAFDAVEAAPGRLFDDLGFAGGRELGEELAVVGEACELFFLDPLHRVAERHFTVPVVVAVAFAVGGHMRELGARAVCRGGTQAGQEALAELLTGVQQVFKGDGPRGRAVVEEDADRAAFAELNAVGLRGIDGGVRRVSPGKGVTGGATFELRRGRFERFRAGWGWCERPDAGALVRGEDRKLDPLLSHHVEDIAGDGCLGQPHAFRFTSEAVFKVRDAPADLGLSVTRRRQRHDDVVVDLSEGGAMAAESLGTGRVGFEDGAVGAGRAEFQPTQQGGPEVVTHARVVVQDARDLAGVVGDAGGAVGGVALGGDALIPVMEGASGALDLDGFQPGILAGWLVKVAMDTDVALAEGGGPGRRRGCHRGFGQRRHLPILPAYGSAALPQAC